MRIEWVQLEIMDKMESVPLPEVVLPLRDGQNRQNRRPTLALLIRRLGVRVPSGTLIYRSRFSVGHGIFESK